VCACVCVCMCVFVCVCALCADVFVRWCGCARVCVEESERPSGRQYGVATVTVGSIKL